MIHVDPPILGEEAFFARWRKKAEVSLDKLHSYYGRGRSPHDRDVVFDDRVWKAPEVKELLRRLFHGKCAYCETLLGSGEGGDMNHFRPKRRVREDPSFPGYWWLAYDLSNIYPSCRSCGIAKRDSFPIDGIRAADPLADLSTEKPLLLEPFKDDPREHLVFTSDGAVSPLSHRGELTIQILALNRDGLRSGRLAAMEDTRNKFKMGMILGAAANLVKDLMGPEHEYAAARRSAVAEYWASIRTALDDLSSPLVKAVDIVAGGQSSTSYFFLDAETTREVQKAALPTPTTVRKAEKEIKRWQISKSRYDIESGEESQIDTYRSIPRRVVWVRLHNFKAFENLTIHFPEKEPGEEAWLMLLGENATGKSSVLQAVALTLMGETHANELGLDAGSFVRKQAAEHHGFVEVMLTNSTNPIRLEFARGETRFGVTPPGLSIQVLGYGATRLLPRSGPHSPEPLREGHVSIKNLFDPTASLSDVDKWLSDTSIVSEEAFQEIAKILREVLLFPEQAEATRASGRVEYVFPDRILGLLEMSDGYQSVIAMVGDIAYCMWAIWKNLKDARGVVLLDEIEAHLHPRWKMSIVSRLRKCFPDLSFIATTHDPLCLRGLRKGEILVFRREGDRVVPLTDIPDLEEFRADQLLTSPLFDLVSTRGPQIESDRARYDALRRQSKRTRKEEREISDLEEKLSRLELPEKSARFLGTASLEQQVNDLAVTLADVQKKLSHLFSPPGEPS